jgi:CubicO group peptidase (beta-lactamase class C family)
MRLAVAVSLALLAVPAFAARPPAPARDLDQLRAHIAEVLHRTGVPGVGIALVAHGQVVWAGGVGLADRAAGKPVTADTLFRVGSITKSFVGLALVKLSEEGRIDLKARVSDLAPELAIGNRWAREAPITVAHLLEHTAGFDDMHFNEMYGPISVENMPLGQILAHNPRSRVARWRPGSRFSYANPGYTVAAYLIEKVSGRPWVDYIRDELLRPMGMNGAALKWSPEVDARLSRGYDDRPDAVPYAAIYHNPAGNLMASPRELAALVQLGLARGRVGDRALVSPAGFARTEQCGTCEIAGLDIDYGLGNHGDTLPPVRTQGHEGGIDGFVSSARYAPDRGIGYVMLLNSTGRGTFEAFRQIRAFLLDYLLGGVYQPPPPPVEIPEAELRPWVGHYHFANPRNQLFAFLLRLDRDLIVSLEDHHLVVEDPYFHARLPLLPLGQNRFRFEGQLGSHVAFGHDSEGRRVLFYSGMYFVEERAFIALLFHYGARAVFWLLLSALALPLAALVWRRRGARVGWPWPLLSTASFFAVPVLFVAGAIANDLGECNVHTVGIFLFTLAFGAGAVGSLVQAVRRLRQPLPMIVRLHRLAVACAAVLATGFFAYYRILGICLWRY